MKFKSDIEVQAGLKDSSGAAGTSGQVLSSNGTTVSWINSGGGFANDVQNTVKAGVAINKGQAVYVTGADGTNIIVGLASNATEATSSKTLGLLNATVAINDFADVIQIGKLAGLDTSTAVVGDPVWLGSNGNLIYGLANKPYAPLHLVYIGVVTRVNANNGEIFVSVQNGFELKEIHDVSAQAPSNNNGIFYNTSNGLWEAKSISAAGGIQGTGTTNYIPKFTGASAIGNSLIYDNGTNVGIGTTSPNNLLTLNSSGAAGNSTSIGLFSTFNEATNRNWSIGLNLHAYGDFAIRTSSTQNGNTDTTRFLINPSGNVGIGTTSPDGTLTVAKSSPSSYVISSIRNLNSGVAGGVQGSQLNFYGDVGYPVNAPTSYIQSTSNDGGSSGQGSLRFGNYNGSTSVECMRITSGGNVGIGTTSPSQKLHIGGVGSAIAFDTTGATGTSIIQTVEDYKLSLKSNRGGTTEIKIGDSNLEFLTNGSERMRITSGGNVLIGTTTDAGYKLDVNGSSRFQGYLNTNNSFEKVFSEAISFPNGTANLAADVRLGNVSFWGYIEVEVNSTYSNQNATGKLTKVFAVGTNPGNLIYTNEARVVDSMGTISDNIAIGDFSWDSTNSTYRIPISHIVSSGNVFTVKVRMFTSESGAKRVFDGMSIGSNYTLTALARQYVYYNGNVGIGTTSPSKKLHVKGGNDNVLFLDNGGEQYTTQYFANNGTTKSFLVWDNTSSLFEIGTAVSADLRLLTNNSERMRITSGGNVGIGTTNPNSNGGASARVVHIHGPASGDWAVNHYTNLNTGANADDGTVVGVIGSGRDMYIFNYEDSNVIIGTNSSERMRITSGGSVLIGTTTDAGYKLDVAGTGRVTGSLTINSATTPFLYFHSTRTSGQSGYIKDDGNMVFQKTEAGGGFRFLNSSSSVLLSIDSGGNSAFINSVTITPPSNQVGFTVNHSGTNGATGSKFNSAGSGTTYGSMTMLVDSCNYGTGIRIVTGLWSASQSAMQFYSGTTSVGSISCTTSATAYNTSSDYRLKENVVPMESSINRLKELNPCRFNFINNPDKTVDGFIAHEVQEVIPEAITGEKDELDYDGSPKYQGIDQSKIVPLLTAALQEAISKIEELENRLLILENK